MSASDSEPEEETGFEVPSSHLRVNPQSEDEATVAPGAGVVRVEAIHDKGDADDRDSDNAGDDDDDEDDDYDDDDDEEDQLVARVDRVIDSQCSDFE